MPTHTATCMLLVLVPVVLLWLIALAIDSSSHPYDVLEAEPELVSGYHVDIGGVLFMVLYLCEGILIPWAPPYIIHVLLGLCIRSYHGMV